MDKNSDDNMWEELEKLMKKSELDDDFDMLNYNPNFNSNITINSDINTTNTNNFTETELNNMEIIPLPSCNISIGDEMFWEVNSEKSYELLYDSYKNDYYKNIINNSNNYSNTHFCHCCRNQLVLSYNDINNFINSHAYSKSKKCIKYLLMVFRLCPHFFPIDIVMNSIVLRNRVYSHLQLPDKFKNNPSERSQQDIVADTSIYETYYSKIHKELNPFVYEIYFHQPNLTFSDYIQCSVCKSYMCPMHFYLSNSNCSKCKFCDKNWVVCGWCKNIFTEEYACKFIHKK